MVEFCEIIKYEGYSEGPSRYFAFYDTISENFISFNGEHIFDSLNNFKLYLRDTPEQEQRYLEKISIEFDGTLNRKEQANGKEHKTKS